MEKNSKNSIIQALDKVDKTAFNLMWRRTKENKIDSFKRKRDRYGRKAIIIVDTKGKLILELDSIKKAVQILKVSYDKLHRALKKDIYFKSNNPKYLGEVKALYKQEYINE